MIPLAVQLGDLTFTRLTKYIACMCRIFFDALFELSTYDFSLSSWGVELDVAATFFFVWSKYFIHLIITL